MNRAVPAGPKPGSFLAFQNNGVAHVLDGTEAANSVQKFHLGTDESLGRSTRCIVRTLFESGIELSRPVWDIALAQALLANEARGLVDEIDSFRCPTDHAAALKALKSVQQRARCALETTGQLNVLEQIEIPLMPILAKMEMEGIKCDKEALLASDEAITKRLAAVTSEIHENAGCTFNIDNSHELGRVLYVDLQLSEDPPRTPTGLFATDEATLCALPPHPIIGPILEYRRLATLKRSYLNTLPRAINPKTGKIHTTFEQLESANGRLVSKNPNLQNIPIASEEGRVIRRAFIPRNDDYLILSADYSQLELRFLAHFSGDETLLRAFRAGEDVHAASASRVFGVNAHEVTEWMRAEAKAINYGIAYGMSPFGLAKRTGRSIKESRSTIESYFARMPRVREFSDIIIDTARRQGFVSTISGRRRYLPEINDRNFSARRRSERIAVCSPIQGSAADLIKLAMVSIHDAIQERRLKTRMLLQVHDELVFDVYRPEEGEVKDLIREKMETALSLSTPLVVNIGVGANWLELN